MKKLLQFILENIVDKADFVIEENTNPDGTYETVKVNKDKIGMVIGKEGKTIKAIQDILRIKGRLENTRIFISVQEA